MIPLIFIIQCLKAINQGLFNLYCIAYCPCLMTGQLKFFLNIRYPIAPTTAAAIATPTAIFYLFEDTSNAIAFSIVSYYFFILFNSESISF